MSSDLEPVILKRSLEKDEVPSSEASVPAVSGAPSEISSVSAAVQQPVKKAKIEKELGDKASARASANKCIELARTANNDDAVRAGKALIGKL